ncbi:ABC transporter substrate-binding protein [Leptospirillum ferrooxidans]|nr:ABC transporter substrate-binding protein [Leptospirillum ferrooxidans]
MSPFIKRQLALCGGIGFFCLFLCLSSVQMVSAADKTPEQSGVPASTMPQVPVFQVSSQPLPKVSDIDLSMEIKKATDALNEGKNPEARNLFENILLDYPAGKVPLAVYLGLARADHRMDLPASVLNLLLPLLKSQILAQSTPSEKTDYLYLIGMADSTLKNDLGTLHYLLPAYKDLDSDARIYAATNVLEPLLAKTDPISSIIMFATMRSNMSPAFQAKMETLISSMVMASVASVEDAQKIWDAFPDRFPGDVAIFKSGNLLESSKHDDQAELAYIHLLANYPESGLTQEAQNRLDGIHFTKEQRPVGVIIPSLVKNPLSPYIRSVLKGVYAAYSSHRIHRWIPSVKSVRTSLETEKTFIELERREGMISCIGPILPKDLQLLKKQLSSGRFLCVSPTLSPSVAFKGVRSVATMPVMLGKAAAMEVLSVAPKDPALTLYPDVPYGSMMERVFAKTLKQGGGEYLRGISYNSGAPDIQPTIESMKTFGQTIQIDKNSAKDPSIKITSPDSIRFNGERFVLFSSSEGSHPKKVFFLPSFRTIFIPDTSGHHARLLRELAYKGIQNQLIIGNDTFLSDSSIPDVSILGKIKAVGTFSRNDLPIENPDIRVYNQTFGVLPDLFALQTIDAAEMINKSLMTTIKTPSQMAYAMKKITHYHGLSGKLRWDPSGQAEKEVHVFGYNDGHWQKEDHFWVNPF